MNTFLFFFSINEIDFFESSYTTTEIVNKAHSEEKFPNFDYFKDEWREPVADSSLRGKRK